MKYNLQGFFHKLAVWKFLQIRLQLSCLKIFVYLLIIYILELDKY